MTKQEIDGITCYMLVSAAALIGLLISVTLLVWESGRQDRRLDAIEARLKSPPAEVAR